MNDNSACPHCGNPLSPSGSVLLCAPGGRGYRVALPMRCADTQCQLDRSAAAITEAVATGVIDP